MSLPSGLRALRHRDFRLFFAGQGLSQLGTWLQLIATSWLVYRLSGSAFLRGLAAFAIHVPFLVLGPLAGVFVDRLDKRRVLLVTNCVAGLQALAMFAVVALGVVEPWHLIAGNLVLGVVSACDSPARHSLIIRIVGGRADLPNAIALNSIMMNGARFVGPALGGAIVAGFGEHWGFGLNALSYLFMIAAVCLMRTPAGPVPAREEGWLRQLAAGARYVYGFLPARCALLLVAATSMTVGSYASLMPWFAVEAFQGDSRTQGLLIGAAGLGAISGMGWLATRSGIKGLLGLIAFSTGGAGAALVAFALSGSLWIAVPALFAVGMGLMLTGASTNTFLQTIVPDDLRGRVASLYVMSFIGTSPLGALVTGWAAERIGPPAALAVGGALAVSAALAYAWAYPAIRREARPLYERIGAL